MTLFFPFFFRREQASCWVPQTGWGSQTVLRDRRTQCFLFVGCADNNKNKRVAPAWTFKLIFNNFIKSDCFEEIFVLSDWNGVKLVSYSSLECTVGSRVVVQSCNKSLQCHKDTFSDPISAGKCNLSMPSKTKSQKRNQIVKLSR